MLRCGYSRLFGVFPFLKTLSAPSNSLVFPNEVLYGRFFYGNWKHASSSAVFAATRITHILNATIEVENYFEVPKGEAVSYHRLSVEDVDDADIA